MNAFLFPLVSRLLLAMAVPALLAACASSHQGGGAGRGTSATQGCGGAVTVYAGDTLYSISRRCNVSVRDLIDANNLSAPYVISPGMSLRVPGSGEYIVQRGDALSLVARRLGVDFQTLARLNGKAPPYTIYVGEKLRVPGSRSAGSGETRGGSLIIASPYAVAKPEETPRSAAKTVVVSAPPSPSAPSSSSDAAAMSPPEARNPAFDSKETLPPSPPPLAGRGFIWPVHGELVTEFGPLGKGQSNDGINIAAARGTPVRATENGVVAYVGNELKGFGNLLLVKHADGWVSAYAHNDQLMVRKGDAVKRGQQIATVGSSGGVDTPQLHFELRKGVEAVNPLDLLKEGA